MGKRMEYLTTLCYIEQNGSYLMLHRITKKNDGNRDKWIGVGGHFEEGESPEECVLREVREETGYTLTSYQYRGIVTFVSGKGDLEYMSLFTADGFEGEPVPCDEGVLEWVPVETVWSLNIWEGDKIFFRLLEERRPFFSLKLVYDISDRLVSADLDGKPMELFDILEEDGSRSGLIRERGVAHREGSLHPTVHVWIVRRRKDGCDILLQKRSAGKDSYPGCYDISSAGHVSAGEEMLPSALRELWEELGIAAEEKDLCYIGQNRVKRDSIFHGRTFRDYEQSSIYVCELPLEISALRLQESEVEEVIWMDYQVCMQQILDGTLPNCICEEEFRMLGEYLGMMDCERL